MTLTQSFMIDIDRGLFEEKSEFLLLTGDKNSHQVTQYFQQNNREFSPGNAIAYFERPDKKAILLTSELSGNYFSTTLSQYCYSKPGIGFLITRCYHGTNGLITVSKIAFRIEKGLTRDIIDPEDNLPSIEEIDSIFNQLQDLVNEVQTKLDQGDFNGETPYIGDNGNWWIGEEDTGVLADPSASDNVVSFIVGDNLYMSPEGRLSVVTTNDAEQDNTQPITSAGVYVQLGNILSLLETI